MNCFETQNLIMQYVNDELSGIRLEGFLEHVQKCDNCREELEMYYTLLTGMQQLDEDKIVTSNYHLAFENKLAKSKRMIARNNKGFIGKLIFLNILVILPTFFMSGDFGKICDRNEVVATLIEESDFSFECFDKGGTSELDELILENFDDIDDYTKKKDEGNNEDNLDNN